MITVQVELPDEFVACIVKVVVANTAVGVPEMTPVDAFSDRPAGNEPPAVIDQLDEAPPVFVGVAGVMVVPTE